MRLLWVLTVGIICGGCVWFGPQYKPVNTDKLGAGGRQIGTLATIAQRRLAIVKFEDGHFCSEPTPDVSDNVSAALTAALSATDGRVQAAGQISTVFAQYAKQLFYRSQGIQLYRDGIFALCNAFLNGAIDKDAYEKQHAELLAAATKLIEMELPLVKDIKSDGGGTPTPPNVSESAKPPVNKPLKDVSIPKVDKPTTGEAPPAPK
jgi:hypothetical protein